MSQTQLLFTDEMSENITVADTLSEYVPDKNYTRLYCMSEYMQVTAWGMALNMSLHMSLCMSGYVSKRVLAKRGLTCQGAFEISFAWDFSK